jgi:hypothetical protein
MVYVLIDIPAGAENVIAPPVAFAYPLSGFGPSAKLDPPLAPPAQPSV